MADGRLSARTLEALVRAGFFWTAWRIVAAGIVVELVLVTGLLRLEDVAGVLARAILIAVLLVGPLGILCALVYVPFWQAGGVAARVSVLRPGGVVVPVAALALSAAAAKALGLAKEGANTPGGSPGALVVLPDRVELWGGRSEAKPRWSAGLADLSMTVGLAAVGRRTWDVVELTDGTHAVALAPRYTARPSQAGSHIDRLLRELGQAPSPARGPVDQDD